MPAFYQSGENVSDLVNTGKLPLSTYFRSGFALLKELCDHGYIDRQRTLVTRKTRDDLTDFAGGESPFMLTGLWASTRLREMANFRYSVGPGRRADSGHQYRHQARPERARQASSRSQKLFALSDSG